VTPAARAAVDARICQLAAEHEHRAAVAAFRAQRLVDRQARTDALVLEAVAALAQLLGTFSSPLCPACHHALAPRRRTCPYCHWCRPAAQPPERAA